MIRVTDIKRGTIVLYKGDLVRISRNENHLIVQERLTYLNRAKFRNLKTFAYFSIGAERIIDNSWVELVYGL